MSDHTLSRQEWIDSMERQIARNMPDNHPSGYARFLAEARASEGGYEKYARGEYAPDNLWEPPRSSERGN